MPVVSSVSDETWDRAHQRQEFLRCAIEDPARSRAYRRERQEELGLTSAEFAARDLYYHVKESVHAEVKRLSELSGVDTRSLSLWLVQVKGYPWRADCDIETLWQMIDFLTTDAALEEARTAPEAPPPRRPPLFS